jgi:pyruvate dehydrogenase E1 component alpha subunit
MDKYSHLFYSALRIRMVEERIAELYSLDIFQSPVHLSIGQEAIAVGVCDNLINDDWVFINYRGHAFYLAKGGPLPEFFAELMGRSSGLSGGKGGSMHLAAPACGVMGSSAVVASTISHAVGAALASKLRSEKRVFVANFGDGAIEEGVFFESLNFASLKKLPVLFLCEDNDLAIHSFKAERQAFDLKSLVESFDIPYFSLEEGYDLLKVENISREVVDIVRQQCKPVFLRIKTCRYMEHVGPNTDFSYGYRNQTDINQWKSFDPLEIDIVSINNFKSQIKNEIDSAIDFAYKSKLPTLEDLFTHVI